MRIKFLISLLFLIFSMGAFAQKAEKDSINLVAIPKFEKMLTKKNIMLLDVRTPEEVSEGHLDGAININYLGENFSDEIQTLDKKKTYLIYCRTGNKTRKAADMMQKSGFKHVYVLDGGIQAWQAAGKPLEK